MEDNYSNVQQPVSTVMYVEPNWEQHYTSDQTTDGVEHEHQMDLSDLCTSVDLEVEVYNRSANGRTGNTNEVYLCSWGGESSKVSFMSGTKIYKDASEREREEADLANSDLSASQRYVGEGVHSLTTSYADAYYYDNTNYGITELFGIESVNVSYSAMMTPQVEIKFVDIRGLALFSPTEKRYNKYNSVSINGVSQATAVQSFFHCFFTFPYPKFTIRIKGFYGQAVTYEMTCSDFKASFRAESGDFEATAKFVGYQYSFLTDVSMIALLAAPYSPGLGKEYWDENISNGKFSIEDKDGQAYEMMTLGEMVKRCPNVMAEAHRMAQEDKQVQETTAAQTLQEDTQTLKEIVNKFYKCLNNEFNGAQPEVWDKSNFSDESKDKPHPVMVVANSDELDFPVAMAFTKCAPNNPQQTDATIERYRSRYNSCVKSLRDAIDGYNVAHNTDIKSPFKKGGHWYGNVYPLDYKDGTTTTEEIVESIQIKAPVDPINSQRPVINDPNLLNYMRKKEYRVSFERIGEISHNGIMDWDAYGGTMVWNVVVTKIRKKEKIDKPKKYASQQIANFLKHEVAKTHSAHNFLTEPMRRALYNAVSSQTGWLDSEVNCDVYISFIHIGNQFALDKILEEQSREVTDEELEYKNKVIQDAISQQIGPFLSIENFTKVVMAHFETFMHMIYHTVELINGDSANRTPQALGISEVININDIPENQRTFIPPFPRLNKIIYDEDDPNRAKNEETWSGAFTSGTGHWYETDLIESILQGVDAVAEIKTQLQQAQEGELPATRPSVLTFPITYGDLFYKNQPYHTHIQINNRLDCFAKEVVTRALAIAACGRDVDYTIAGRTDGANMNNAYNQGWGGDVAKAVKQKENSVLTKDFIIGVAKNASEYEEYQTSKYGAKNVIKETTDGKYEWDVAHGGFDEDTTKSFPFNDYSIDINDSISSAIIVSPGDEANEDLYNDSCFEIKFGVAEMATKYNQLTNSSFADSFKKLTYSDEGVRDLYNSIAFGGKNEHTNVLPLFSSEYELTNDKRQFNGSFDCMSGTTTVWGNGKSTITGITTTEGNVAVGDEFINDIIDEEGMIDGGFYISEIYGYNTGGTINYNTSLFTQKHFSNLTDVNDTNGKVAMFLLSLQIGDLTQFNNVGELQPIYVPYVSVLQMGAYAWILDEAENWEFGQRICKNLSWRSAVTKYLDAHSYIVREKIKKEFTDFATKNFSLLYQLFGISKPGLETLYSNLPANLIGNDAKIALMEISGDLTSKYLAIGTTISSLGFRLANKYSEQNEKLLNTLMVPTLLLPINVYALKSYENKPISISKGNLDAYVGAFIKKFVEQTNLDPSQNSEYEDGAAITTADPYNDTTEDVKISLYNYFKLIYDKWIPSNKEEDWDFNTFFRNTDKADKGNDDKGHNFFFIDSYYKNIGKELYYNFEKTTNQILALTENNNYNTSLFDFLGGVYSENKCNLICLQNFMDISKKENMAKMFQPIPYNYINKINKSPDFIVMYPYQASTNLDIEGSDYEDDGFDLRIEDDIPIGIKTTVGDGNDFVIPAFGVVYGKQYQHYFESIDVDMNSPAVSEVALKAKFAIANAARDGGHDGEKVTYMGQDLFTIYANNAYDCKVTMMGCAWVQPLMYFVLTNVPMFRGSYLIKNVQHTISVGDMKTTFTGTRMSNIASRLNRTPFIAGRSGDYNDIEAQKNSLADISNNCPYKVYPLFSNAGHGKDLSSILNKSVRPKNSNETTTYLDMIARVVERENGAKPSNGNNLATMLSTAQIYNYFVSGNEEDFYRSFGYTGSQWNGDKGCVLDGGAPKKSRADIVEIVRNIFTYSPTWILAQPNGKSTAVSHPVTVKVGSHNFTAGQKTKGVTLKVEDLQNIYLNVTHTGYPNPSNTQSKMPLIIQQAAFAGNVEDTVWTSDTSKKPPYWTSEDDSEAKETEKNSIETVVKNFQSCLSQTMNSNDQLRCKLKYELVKGTQDTLKITQEDGKNNHLAQVYDVCINGYTDNCITVKWNTSNVANDNPDSVTVKVAESIGKSNLLYDICDNNGNAQRSQDGNGYSKNFYCTFIKRYGDNLYESKECKKDCPPLAKLAKETMESIVKDKEITVEDCENLITRLGSGTGSGQLLTDNLQNGHFNITKAANYLISNAYPTYIKGKCGHCARAVELAVQQGGCHIVTGDGYTCAVNYSKDDDWVKKNEGTLTTKEQWDALSRNAQVGDIIGTTHPLGGKEVGHISMFCGSQNGWYSDFRQKSCYVYGKYGYTAKYIWIRHKNES